MENVKTSNLNEYQKDTDLNLKDMLLVKQHYTKAANLIDLFLSKNSLNENIRNNQ